MKTNVELSGGKPRANVLDFSARTETEQVVTLIRPVGGWHLPNFRELWDYRGLMFHFILRDIKVRYKYTILGIGWAVLQPFLMMMVFVTFFSLVRSGGGENYPLLIYTGIMPWLFFSSATIAAANSIVHSEHLITRIFFPRLVTTFASVGVYLVDFTIAFGLLLGLLWYFRVVPVVWIIAMPLVALLFTFAALSIGITLAALNVTYRDFRLVIPFMMQLWFFATTVTFLPPKEVKHVEPEHQPGYEYALDFAAGSTEEPVQDPEVQRQLQEAREHEEEVKARYEFLLFANPLASLMVTFRATILGGAVPWLQLGCSMGFFVLLFLIGSFYFHRVEDKFADII